MRQKIGTVLGIIVLLVFSYVIPNLVTMAEDKNLVNASKTYEIDNVVITQNVDYFFEELDNFPAILSEPTVYVKAGKNYTKDQMYDMMLDFAADIAATCGDIDFSRMTTSILKMNADAFIGTSSDYESVYYFWACSFVANKKDEYLIWFDDATGKVLGFECPLPHGFWEDPYMLSPLADVLAEHYGFSGGVFYNPYEVSDAVIIFYNEDKQQELVLPLIFTENSLMCNIHDNEYTAAGYKNVTDSEKAKSK